MREHQSSQSPRCCLCHKVSKVRAQVHFLEKPLRREVLRNSCRVCAGADPGLFCAAAFETEAVEALLVPCLGDFRASEYGVSEGAEGVRGDAEWPVGEEEALGFRLKETSRARSCCR